MLTFKPSSKEKGKSWPRGRAEISAAIVHLSPWEPDWPKASCSEAAGTKTSLGQRYQGTWWSKHSMESTVESHLGRACKATLHLPRQQNLPNPCGFTPALSAAGGSTGEGQKASHARASDHLSNWEGRPAWSLAAQLLFACRGCTLGATVPSSSPLRGHSPCLGDSHILIDSARTDNAFQFSLWQLLEVVRGQPRGGISRCITGHQPRVAHHHPGCQIHLLAKDCQGERQRESTR